MLKTSIQFGYSKLSRKAPTEGHLMVSLQAEEGSEKRTPVCVGLVLDRSGSMSGQKMRSLQVTACKLVQHLTPQDRVAVIAYDSRVQVVQGLTVPANKEALQTALASIQTGSTTNLSGGMLRGFEEIRAPFDGVRRVLLLTDGLPNEGVDDREGLLRLVNGRPKETTLTTFGYGTDCDQELLADLARRGGGNYYFIDGVDTDAVFGRELGGLANCVAQNLEIRVLPTPGLEVLEVLNDFDVREDGGACVVTVDDIHAGETKHALIRCRITPPARPSAQDYPLAKTQVGWSLLAGGAREEDELVARGRFVKKADVDQEEALAVTEQVDILTAARQQWLAVQAANAGDFDRAQHHAASSQGSLARSAGRGSSLARRLVSILPGAGRFTSDRYSPAFGASISSQARGALKNRRTSAGGLDDAYSNLQAEEMVRSFDESDLGGDGDRDSQDRARAVFEKRRRRLS